METIWKTKRKTYPPLTLNFSKGVMKSPDLASCSLEEIRLHLKPQGVTAVGRTSICKETRTIDTNTYILTFNKPTTPTSIRIGYINTKIETFISCMRLLAFHIALIPLEKVYIQFSSLSLCVEQIWLFNLGMATDWEERKQNSNLLNST